MNSHHAALCCVSSVFITGALHAAQPDIILDNTGMMKIDYPACYDGAYIFIQESTNLTGEVWQTIDYKQVQLESAAPVMGRQSLSEGSSLTSLWELPSGEKSGFYKIVALSFLDFDGDGVDNITEYYRGTNPFVSDVPPISLPPDDGDPRPVPGSVTSSPGDWNTLAGNNYRSSNGLYETVNLLILAMDGTNGTFITTTTVGELGAWVEDQCGQWITAAAGDNYPKVTGGRFFRTPDERFTWTGKEHIFPLSFYAYDGSEQFVNHLVQSSPSDTAGLARLSDNSPVLVNTDNPWTEEKLGACLEQLKTVQCRVQGVKNGNFDISDSTAMAQSRMEKNAAGTYYPPAPTDQIWQPNNIVRAEWEYDWISYRWLFQSSSFVFTRNQQFAFLDNLQAHGFGPSVHRGYVGFMAEYEWSPYSWGYRKSAWQTTRPEGMLPDLMTKTFESTDNQSAWFIGGDINYCDARYREIGQPNMPGGRSYFLSHQTGFQTFECAVLTTLDPPLPHQQTLVMDMDRDGIISTNDFNRVDKSQPYRFWVNEDGNGAGYPEADLEDFFPAMFKETESDQTFRLSANMDLNYIPTSMVSNNCQQYLQDIDLAQHLSGQILNLVQGSQTSQVFNDGQILLLAASEINKNAELYVHVMKGGSEVSVSTNHFSFSSVTDMYRIQNFRTGGTSSIDEPSNWPDELTNGKDLLFVHGFNVKDEFDLLDIPKPLDTPARMWQRNIFKRLWLSGSNARYHGIIWDGIGQGSLMTHYQHSVVNAFATAPLLAGYIQMLSSSETVVLGHSLGNMVVSSAISEHNAPVSQYYALDAAVALEAYGDVTANVAFIPDVYFTWEKTGFLNYERRGWRDYPHETWASEWYRLFPESDPRSELTFRHKFADLQEKTDVFNFYSSTEDVLGVHDDVNSITELVNWTSVRPELRFHILPVDFTSDKQCAWQLQEMYKGQNNWLASYSGGGSSKQAGWGFTKTYGQHLRRAQRKVPGSHPPRFIYERYTESPEETRRFLDPSLDNEATRIAYLTRLQTDPLFRREPDILFEGGAVDFVSGTVGDYQEVLDYDNGELLGAPDIDVSNVVVRDWLLAKAFPARTGPMGSGPHKEWSPQGVNFDMYLKYRTDPKKWPIKDSKLNSLWRHSDWKNAPYVHVFKLFETISGKESSQ